MIPIVKILLQKLASGENFSLEAGVHDGQRNFDHHGKFAGNPAPCNNPEIRPAPEGATIEISHLDGDTFVGLLRMTGRELPVGVDLSLMERIDLNGSSVCREKFHPTRMYMVGVGEFARQLKFPRVSEEPQEVTGLVVELASNSASAIIEAGRLATEKSEASYRDCKVAVEGKVGLWAIGAEDPLDPSRPYEDGVETVIVYRRHFETVSIYASPASPHAFGGKEVAGISFAGHPKACGSPRGMKMSEENAKRVFEAIAAQMPEEARVV
ncbi:teicoplanin resistance protein VanZ [Candidatus Parcubacteria bacterium]|nr:MAG: teicoplanin resistance protein VanZ [Candidatus Parcubacteria bacterium]